MNRVMIIPRLLLPLLLLLSVLLPGCTDDTIAETESPNASPAISVDDTWQWPEMVYIAAAGSSGMAKYLSWASLMEKDIDTKLRIIPEANSVHRFRYVNNNEMFLTKAGKSSFRNVLEALESNAIRDGGPFQARVVWVHALSNSGVYVRGDSEIQTIYDIKAGHRWAVWSDQYSVMKVPQAILDWAQVSHDDITWVVTGSYEACQRAVADGNADITWGFPTSPSVYEAAAAPHGIRYLDLNAEENPEGAERFRLNDPMYVFGPIANGVPEAIGHWGTMGYSFNITHTDSDPEMVYRVVTWLYENYDSYTDAYDSNEQMNIDHLLISLGQTYLPYHEGLIRFLKEKGYWTELHEKRNAINAALLDRYCEAYPVAIAMADAKGIEVNPLNPEWLELWENYKKELGLPPFLVFLDLEEVR